MVCGLDLGTGIIGINSSLEHWLGSIPNLLIHSERVRINVRRRYL